MNDVAPDGSPVAFYRRLPATGEPELIHATIGAGASVLDRLLDEPTLRSLLDAAGLAFVRWLERPGWYLARRRR